MSENQKNTLKQYEINGYKCIISSDYDYFLGMRIKYQYCDRLLKNDKTLGNHQMLS